MSIRSWSVRAVAIAGGLLVASPSHAAWPHDSAANLAVCAAANGQGEPVAMSDGAGGAFVAWKDYRTPGTVQIYMQRVSAAGSIMWADNGVPVLSVPANSFVNFGGLVSDGAGGAILGWSDHRGATFDAWAQRINGLGAVQWAANGVPLCASSGDQGIGGGVSDGAGGAIFAWDDNRAGSSYDIYAQRVNGGGVAQWTANGTAICTAPANQSAPVLDTDGAGGAIVCWRDVRGGTDVDLYAQRVSALGTPQWTGNGVVVSNALGDQTAQRLVADGTGGAIIAWSDTREIDSDIYAQHLSLVGSIEWTANGISVCNVVADQYSPAMISDAQGGAFVSWIDRRWGRRDVYTQRLSGAGVGLLNPDASYFTANAATLAIAPGGSGAITAWDDEPTSGAFDVRVTSLNGLLASGATGNQQHPTLVSDGSGGCIVVWDDSRGGTTDIYAQNVERWGFFGSPEPVIADVRDVPGDQGGMVAVRWQPSYLDVDPYHGYIASYRLWRSVPPQAQAALAPGARRGITTDADEAAATGELWVGPRAAAGYAWEYVGAQAPTNPPPALYSLAVATASDSLAGSNPPTAFMVQALRFSGQPVPSWSSAPDSGYSVDNLAPATPSPLTGTYAAGITRLHWAPNTEPDLANYRVYRGTTPGFLPSGGSLLAVKPDTGFVDNAGSAYYYKLTAVDVHGNESGAATYPDGTTDVGQAPAVAFTLEPPMPNPARAGTTIRYSLPQATRARLEVFDTAGRRMRVLHDGAAAAGPHSEAFPLDDASGHPIPSGLYLVRLESAGRSLTRRIAVVR